MKNEKFTPSREFLHKSFRSVQKSRRRGPNGSYGSYDINKLTGECEGADCKDEELEANNPLNVGEVMVRQRKAYFELSTVKASGNLFWERKGKKTCGKK